jgi:mRNA-degrading endonuclease RelE of RelBE toxin-antitoxin system
MLQIVFNEISAAELSRLPTQIQFVLLEALNIQPDDVEQELRLTKRFGVITHGKSKLYRCRAGDYRIYFAVEGAHVKVHRVLHKNTIQDFLFRSNLGSAGEDAALGEAKGFWKLIEDGERTLKVV